MRPMRILLLADIHANLPALNSILKIVEEQYQPIDFTLTLGDYVGYNAFPNEVMDYLFDNPKIKIDFFCLGNHDLACATGNASGFRAEAKEAALWTNSILSTKAKTIISYLPEYKRFHLKDFQWDIYAVHGSPTDPTSGYLRPSLSDAKKDEFLAITEARLLIHGHTHIPHLYQSKKYPGKAIINPGSVGQPRDGNPKAAAALLEVTSDPEFLEVTWIRASYPVIEVSKANRRAKLPHKLSERLIFGE